MITDVSLQTRPVGFSDHRRVSNLTHFSPYQHRHLDWRHPLDWIGCSPFLVLEKQKRLVAALACPPDPPAVAWIRLFVNSGEVPLDQAWEMLWEAARGELSGGGRFLVAAIALQPWFPALLKASGFVNRQSILMLERHGPLSVGKAGSSLPVLVRLMQYEDIPAVAEVDACAFDLLWQNSPTALGQAYSQAALATVAEEGGQIIGYQISTSNPAGIHLARLAVRPEAQGRGVGHALLVDLIRRAEQRDLYHITVNTQSDNLISQALYRKNGFQETGERYPVYQIEVPCKEAV